MENEDKDNGICQCGRKTYMDSTRESEHIEVPHCPRCEGPARMCMCDDLKESE